MTTEPTYAGEFILSEGPRSRSRDQVTIAVNQTLLAGTVLGATEVGALGAASVANPGNTGNMTVGNLSATGDAKLGVWSATLGNATHFGVNDPDGIVIGEGNMGAQFNGAGLSFAITAGSVAGVQDDGFEITVSQGAAVEEFAKLNPAASDGTQRAAGISFAAVTTGGSTAQAVAITRAAEVKGGVLDWGNANATQIAVAEQQLAALGIIVR
jgi:Bacteriophage lambda head decoration protein D